MPKEEDVPIGEFNEDAPKLFYFVGMRWICMVDACEIFDAQFSFGDEHVHANPLFNIMISIHILLFCTNVKLILFFSTGDLHNQKSKMSAIELRKGSGSNLRR